MLYFLFIFYCFLFCWLITRINFFKKSGLSTKILVCLFAIRILSLMVGCYVNIHILAISDSLEYQKRGIEQFHLLFQNPGEYFSNLFHTDYASGYSRFLDDSKSFWNNLRTILIGKMLSVFDLFSFQNFWINTLFYNFLVFFGNVALYKVFIRLFPKDGLLIILCVFLFPSALFYTSMINRDGLIFLSLSMVIYHVFLILNSGKASLKRILLICFFLMVILLLRNFVFIILIPALIAWIIAVKYPKKAFLTFVLVYLFSTIFFFLSGFLSKGTNLPEYVSQRQQSFIELSKSATSAIPIDSLSPTLKGFLFNTPQSLNHAFMRPYLWERNGLAYIPFALEILLAEILFLLFIFFHKKKKLVDPFIYFCIFSSVSMLLVTGYTIPIMGAIVRYRSIYLLFLVIPIVCYTDWVKIGKKLAFERKDN